MEKIELFDLIESYLAGTLSEEKVREVERRMMEDVAFRREVELHRGLQENYSAPGRWRLRTTLGHVMKEPFPANDPTLPPNASLHSRRVKWTIFMGILLVGIMIGYWIQSPLSNGNRDPLEIQPSAPVPDMKTDTVLPATPKETLPPSQKSEEKLLFAEANPTNFVPNSSMEALVDGGLRNFDGFSFRMTSPFNDATFTPDKKGETLIQFAGTLEGVFEEAPSEVFLAIFNNKDVAKPLLSVPLGLKNDTAGLVFEIQKRLNFPPGLYYFYIEQQGELLYTGKFTLGKLKK